MVTSRILFTKNLDLVRNCKCYGYEAVALVDSTHDLVELDLNPDVVQIASILLPSYEASSEYMNGNEQGFVQFYTNQLNSPNCDEFIALLVYALYTNHNILLYVGEDDGVIPYVDILAAHILQTYGIILGVEEQPSSIDPNALPLWMIKFYIHNFITAEDFLNGFVPNTDIPPEVLNKLCIDYPMDDYSRRFIRTIEDCNRHYVEEVNIRHGLAKTLYYIRGKK